VPAVLVDGPAEQASDPIAAVVLDLPDGGRLSIFASASPALAAAALKAVR
jgi:transposase